MRLACPGLALLASSCAGDGSDDARAAAPEGGSSAAAAETGTLVMRFTLGGAALTSRNLVDPLEGPVYGSIFQTSDVTLTGPADGAEAVESVFVESVDLREREVSEASWEADLPAGDYTFLGFWDIDHSSTGDPDPRPDMGDPVPLPGTNSFSIHPNELLEFTATFDLVYAF